MRKSSILSVAFFSASLALAREVPVRVDAPENFLVRGVESVDLVLRFENGVVATPFLLSRADLQAGLRVKAITLGDARLADCDSRWAIPARQRGLLAERGLVPANGIVEGECDRTAASEWVVRTGLAPQDWTIRFSRAGFAERRAKQAVVFVRDVDSDDRVSLSALPDTEVRFASLFRRSRVEWPVVIRWFLEDRTQREETVTVKPGIPLEL